MHGTLLVISVALLVWLHQSQKQGLVNEALSRLGGVTSTIASQTDGGRVTRLLNTFDSPGTLIQNTQDAYYYVMHQELRKAAELNRFGLPLEVVAFDPQDRELQLVVTSEPRPAIRELRNGPGSKEISAYLTEGRVDPLRYTAGDRLFAVNALRDGRGKVTGAIVAMSPLDEVGSAARSKLMMNILLTAVIFTLAGVILFRSVGRWVKHEENERAAWQVRHTGVTDSIAYAGKIQRALIPRPEVFRQHFDRSFVLNRPKEQVSGDFHWFHKIDDDRCLLALADCTGHGLPGAMMAAIGCALLNDLVMSDPLGDPAAKLGSLNQRLVQTLHQNGQRKGAGDGMDMALCRIDRAQREIIFAGAYRPLYWVHDGQLTVINGDRKPIGGSHFDPERTFTSHRIAYHPGDRIYLFSDGYVDQFGGPDRKKFMTPRFNALLLGEQHHGMDAQAEVLARVFDEWKGKEEQVDDVCVVGLEM